MIEKLKHALVNTNDDAEFMVYKFLEYGRYQTEFKKKKFVEDLLQQTSQVKLHYELRDVLVFKNGEYGIPIQEFNDNYYYETKNVEGFEEHVSKYNKYHNIFIKLNKEEKTIEFKLGDKHKKLELIEHTDYVSKPHYKTKMKIYTVEELDRHIHDEFWNPRMITIGRRVLGLEKAVI